MTRGATQSNFYKLEKNARLTVREERLEQVLSGLKRDERGKKQRLMFTLVTHFFGR